MSATDMQANKNREGTNIAAMVQKFGRFLSGMIMPNIGAFIAWGLITAMFIPTGWVPNETFALMVSPMITYLLPLIIGYTGGRMVYGQRGAVIGAIATMGVVVGADVPMFLGAMAMGPFAAWCLKQIEKLWADKVKAGFEMLVDNFSIGILGTLLAMFGQWIIGPVVEKLVEWAGNGVDALVEHNLLPLASLIVEPAKVLFLNNAINHGVFTPLGAQEVLDDGKSLLFMIESNPGPGLGILVAFALFGPRLLKFSAPSAIIIHFFGGIHEVYFPFVLAKPKMIIAAIAGGMTGVLVGTLFNGGLVSAPSPGSIFAYFTFTPPGGYVVMLAQVLLAAAVSFAVASFLLGFGREAKRDDATEDAATHDAAVPVA